jgi:hypothetical protein
MIRRGFWFAAGAVAGIMGYRRAAALGRRAASRSVARDAIRAAREARGFSRDVRAGMDLYMARRARPIPPTLPASTLGSSKQGSSKQGSNQQGADQHGPSQYRATTHDDATAKDDR